MSVPGNFPTYFIKKQSRRFYLIELLICSNIMLKHSLPSIKKRQGLEIC